MQRENNLFTNKWMNFALHAKMATKKNGPSVWCLVCKKPCLVEKKNLLTPCFSDGSNGLFVIPGLPHNQPCLCSVYVPSFRLRKKTKKMKTLEVYAMYLAQLWKKKNHTVHTQKINNSNCHVTYTCWPRYTGELSQCRRTGWLNCFSTKHVWTWI